MTLRKGDRWMLKAKMKAVLLTVAGALLVATAPAAAQAPESQQLPSDNYATEQQKKHDHGHGHWQKEDREKHMARRLKHLQEAAQYFGISIEGKSAKELHAELKSIRTSNPAKWEQFKAERKAKRLAALQEEAKRLGISTEGKTTKQICAEIVKKRKLNGSKVKQ